MGSVTKFLLFIVMGVIIKLKSQGGFFVIDFLNYAGMNVRIIHVCFIIVIVIARMDVLNI